jgi:hypothetical protein
MEEFRKITNYSNYSISDFGNIRNDKTNRILSPSLSGPENNKYLVVNLRNNDGVVKNVKIHKLVAQEFLEPIPNKILVDHIDNNTSNNRIENLRFCNCQENARNKRVYSNSTLECKGVSFFKKTNKYVAYIYVDRRKCHLGIYETFEEAKQDRKKYANFFFGDFTNRCEKL